MVSQLDIPRAIESDMKFDRVVLARKKSSAYHKYKKMMMKII